MPETAYAPAPTYSPKDYEQAKKALATGTVRPDMLEHVQGRMAEFEKAQAELTQAHGYTQSSQLDPAREEIVKKVRMATRDDTLKNNSGLKVFGGQTEYVPPPKPANPFSAFGSGLGAQSAQFPTDHAWREPSVKDFRAALAEGGSLAERAKAELGKGAYGDDSPPEVPRGPNEHAAPKVKDITQLGNKPADPALMDDAALENTEAFRAYQDAAWNHALADSIAQRKPIYRLKHTDKLSPEEKMIAEAQDVGGAVLGGAGQAATLGLLDPMKRSINPKLAAEDRQQRNRNPKAEMAGELGGAFLGAPEVIARGSAKILGSRLGDTALGRLGASVGAGAITGGVDSQTRSIAQAAADALDAGDSAQEMASRIYDALSGKTILEGAGMGTGAAVTGHAVGSALGKGARNIVTSGEGDLGRAATIKQNLDTGGKMDWKGQIKTEPEIENLTQGAPYDMPADEALARKASKPMLKQRRLEQEAAHREADDITATARERLGGQTVPVEDTAARLEQYADGLVNDTAASQVRKLARKLRKASLLSPEELDKYIDEMDDLAGYDKGQQLAKKREHFVEAGRILREDRDSLRFDEPTNAGGFAVRDSRGNVKSNTDYSATKTELSRKQHILNEENQALSLPKDIPARPQKLPGGAPDDLSRDALAESTEPNVQLDPDQEKAFLRGIQDVGVPGKSVETKAKERLASRSGVSKEVDLIKKMRARQDYRKLLGQAMNGVSVGSGGLGNKFLSTNQFLRAVPGMRSLAGGLPKMEATQDLVDLVDRHLAQQAGQGRAATGDRILDEMVPEAKALNLRGGQPAKTVGAVNRNEKGDDAKLTPEESAVAKAVIRQLIKLQEGN